MQCKSHWRRGFLNVQMGLEVCMSGGGGLVVMGGLLLGQAPELHLAQVVCAVGRGDHPLRHQSSLPRTLEVALAQCGLGEAAQVAVVRRSVKAAAEAALAAVLALEADLSVEQRGGRQVCTDFLGECGRLGMEAGGREARPEGGPR